MLCGCSFGIYLFCCVGGVVCNVISSIGGDLLVLVLLVLAYSYSLEKGCLWMRLWGRSGIYFSKCCFFVSVSNDF